MNKSRSSRAAVSSKSDVNFRVASRRAADRRLRASKSPISARSIDEHEAGEEATVNEG